MKFNSEVIIAAGTCAAVLAAFLTVWWQIRTSRRLTSLQLFLQLIAQYESTFMHRKRASLAHTLLSDPKTLKLDDTVLMFFETLGHLNRRGFIDLDLVWNSFGVDVCYYWPALRHYVTHIRKGQDDITIFWEFEKMKKRLSIHKPWKGPSPNSLATDPTSDKVEEFLQWETLRAGNPQGVESPK